jgi:Zn-dependent peptidase ImmA (M78 family)
VYERRLPGPAQRFAIAHAICHLILDGERESARPGCIGDPEAEQRADWFAAELLVPRRELAEIASRRPSCDPEEHEIYLDHVDELASRFGVPSAVIDTRIRESFQIRRTG